MKTLLVIACLWIANLVILQSPNNKGTAKQSGTGGTNSPRNSSQGQNTSANPPSNGKFVDCNQGSSQGVQADCRAQEASHSNEDVDIQREIAKFTRYLVYVGGLQFLALAGTLVVVGMQAKLMGTHATHLHNLAKAANSNAQAAILQVRAMQEQITQMAVQSGILQESVQVARDSSIAANKSAEASQKNITLLINKERALIRIVKPEKLPELVVGNLVSVGFKLLFNGTTPAYKVTSTVGCTVSESKDSAAVPRISHRITDLPDLVSEPDIKPLYHDFLLEPLQLDDITLDRIKKLELFIHFAGKITYKDFVEEPRETAFHYRWTPADTSSNSIRRLVFPEGWFEVGGEKENYYT